ncbi:hypothetical protein FQN53_007595 [Emmonsiellopsis sp. PD_33]|nr:hypothetical protein FQN53_007595 [Emmonsiellopsis sp. PD_33]
MKSSIISTFYLIAAASAAKIDVKVGDGGLKIEPNNIPAKVGDDIVFHFFEGNHDVASGPFNQPCSPSPNGFYSGLINTDGQQPDATFTVRINNTDPIWLYCTTSGHCQGGMTAVINPPASGNSLDDYQDAAEDARSTRPAQVRGGIFSENGDSMSPSASSSPSASNTGTGSAASPTSTGGASTIFTQDTLLFNTFAALVAVGAGWVGLL